VIKIIIIVVVLVVVVDDVVNFLPQQHKRQFNYKTIPRMAYK
jgi:hypothetical protein